MSLLDDELPDDIEKGSVHFRFNNSLRPDDKIKYLPLSFTCQTFDEYFGFIFVATS